MWGPILASMLIVSSGFALFLLSSFPPTRRLGVLVCIGAAMTDLAASFQPEDRARELYDNLFTQVYRPLYPAIQSQLQRLWHLRAEST